MKNLILGFALLFIAAWAQAQPCSLSAGTYQAATVQEGAGIVKLGAQIKPTCFTGLKATASAGFLGNLAVDTATGAIRVINPRPVGTYTVTVTSYDNSQSVSTSFSLTVAAVGCGSSQFIQNSATTVGNLARSARTGDFNADGHLDVITPNSSSNSVFISFGNGNGGFLSNAEIPTAMQPFAVGVGDFNGDGLLDFVSANQASSTVSVHINNGLGAFSTLQDTYTALGFYFEDLLIADFNLDGHLDYGVVCRGSNNVVIGLGSGSGAFSMTTTAAVGANCYGGAVADFNQDGFPDIVTANASDNSASVCLGLGDGTLAAPTNIPTGNYPYRVQAADFNKDGFMDFVTVNIFSGNLSVAYGSSGGGFSVVSIHNDFRNCSSMSLIDINGDGYTEIATGDFGSVRIHQNNAGVFSATQYSSFTFSGNALGLEAADLNEDGVPDLAIAIFNFPSTVLSFLSDMGSVGECRLEGNGVNIPTGQTFASATDHTDFGSTGLGSNLQRTFTLRNTGTAPLQVNGISFSGADAAHFSASGLVFPVILPPASSVDINLVFQPLSAGMKQVTCHIQTTDCSETDFNFVIRAIATCYLLPGVYASTVVSAGTAVSSITPQVLGCPVNLQAVASAGFRGSLHADPQTGVIKVVNPGPAGVYTVKVTSYDNLSSQSTSFQLTVTDPACSPLSFSAGTPVTMGNLPRGIKLADFNNDGFLDVISPNSGSDAVYISYGTGNGGFGPSVGFATGLQPFAVAVGDFNGDGRADFISANQASNTFSVHINDGSGGFVQTQNEYTALGFYFEDMFTDDFNLDGRLDFGIVCRGSNNVIIGLGNGLGTFSATYAISTGSNCYSGATADFDNNGIPDIVTVNSGANNASVCFGVGDGTFLPPVLVATGNYPYRVVTADFNKDGFKDFASSNLFSNDISVALGSSGGTFTVTSLPTGSRSCNALSVADMNGDGYSDLVSGAFGDFRIHLSSAGTFNGSNFVSQTVNGNMTGIETGELNGDGMIDVVVPRFNFGSDFTAYLSAGNEIGLLGNGMPLTDGQTSVSSADGTDFGLITTGQTAQYTYSIQNSGTNPLDVSNIQVSGPDASMFTVTGLTFPLQVPGGSSVAFNIIFDPTGSGIRQATVTVSSNDCNEQAFEFAVRGESECLPAIVIGTTATPNGICVGASSTLTASSGSQHLWQPGNINGNNVLVSPAATTTYSLTALDDNGCPATGSVTVTVSSVPAPPQVTGLVNVCALVGLNVAINFNAYSEGAVYYNWTLPPNTVLESGQGDATAYIRFLNGFITQANKQIRVTAGNNCGVSTATVFYLTAQAPTTPKPITGPTNACPYLGSTATYSVPQVPGASNYIWTAQPGVTITPVNPGLGAFEVVVSFPVTFTTSPITVQAVTPCGISGTRSLMIYRNNPPMPGPISGPLNVCGHLQTGGFPATYTSSQIPGASYNWILPAGAGSVSGQGTNQISFLYPDGFTGGNISVQSINGCGTSLPRSLAVTRQNPGTPGIIDIQNISSCPNRIYSYALPSLPTNASSVYWTVTGGAILSGQSSTAILVSYPPGAVNAVVSAQGINNCDSSLIRSISVKLPECPPDLMAGKQAPVTYDLQELSAEIFPNPGTVFFNLDVKTSRKEQIQVRLTDLHGRSLLLHTLMPGQRLRLGERLAAGVYLVEILQAGNRVTKKWIKN